MASRAEIRLVEMLRLRVSVRKSPACNRRVELASVSGVCHSNKEWCSRCGSRYKDSCDSRDT